MVNTHRTVRWKKKKEAMDRSVVKNRQTFFNDSFWWMGAHTYIEFLWQKYFYLGYKQVEDS